MKHPLLGKVAPDMAAQILGTRYLRFSSCFGIDGLARWTEIQLEVLAVHATMPGSGQFRNFIAAAKHFFPTLCVWHDDNPIVGQALARYGFTREEIVDEFGAPLRGWRWDAPQERIA